jgi:hypothetical protein
MANNFINAIKTNISTDGTIPTTVYSPSSIKAICIELDVSNNSSAGVTVDIEIEDDSAKTSTTAITFASATERNAGTMTKTAGAHNLETGDRVIFTVSSAPSFTDGSLPPSAEASLSVTRIYYVQNIPSTTKFRIAETRGAVAALTWDTDGSTIAYIQREIATIVRQAPVPVGGALKVIAGQKLVLAASDKLYATSSSAYNVDVVASILADVS